MMIRTILLASAAAVATFATPALAQSDAATQSPAAEDAPNGSDIVVTGSRIRRQDLAGVGPATVVSAEQIENTGLVNIEQVLPRLPAHAGFAGNQRSAYWTNNESGRAPRRDRVCQSEQISGGAVSLKKDKPHQQEIQN